jgi:hypothetical protein
VRSDPPGPGKNPAGLGIFRYQRRCGTVWGHTANFFGYTQFMAASPNGRRSVTVSVNEQLTPKDGARTSATAGLDSSSLGSVTLRLPYSPTFGELDFSHSSKTGWCGSPPIPLEEGPSRGRLGAPLSDLDDEARSGPRRPIRDSWPGRLGRMAVLVSLRLVLLLSGAREEAISDREGSGDFLRVARARRPAKSPRVFIDSLVDALCHIPKD